MKSVSVIIPLFNKEAYIAECLASICAQTHKPLEVIVVDDGSSDTSASIVRNTQANFEQAGIALKLLEGKHAGVSRALNKALAQAQGTYVTRIDTDDLVDARWLETLFACNTSSKPVSIRCMHKRVLETYALSSNQQLPPISEPALPPIESGNQLYHQLFANMDTNLMSACGTLYVRAELLRADITFNEKLSHTEDLLFNAQYFAHGYPAILAPEPLYYYRQLDDSLSHASSNLFDSVSTLSNALEKLSTQKTTRQIATDNESAALRYLCWYYSIAILDLEKTATEDEFKAALNNALDATSMVGVFERAKQEHVVPQVAWRLFRLAQNKQYAQLRLAARTLNVGRSIRRSVKTQ